MSSSTSSSERPPRCHALWRIAGFLAALFLLLEAATRLVLIPRSKDFTRFEAYPQRAKQLVSQSGLRVAFLGNSSTERGIDPALFERQLSKLDGQPVHAEMFVADGSEIDTWYYMARHSFWQPDHRPDWIILHFYGNSLDDSQRPDIGRLAMFFTDRDDWPELFDFDLPTLSDRTEYVLSTVWATYATRDRIKKRVLCTLVPDYKELAQEINACQYRRQEQHPPPQKPVTFHALTRFLAAARQQQNKVCFVAFPQRVLWGGPPGELSAETVRLVREAGMELLDMRLNSGLAAEHYEDRVHLTPAGARIYTQRFAEEFAALLRRP